MLSKEQWDKIWEEYRTFCLDELGRKIMLDDEIVIKQREYFEKLVNAELEKQEKNE